MHACTQHMVSPKSSCRISLLFWWGWWVSVVGKSGGGKKPPRLVLSSQAKKRKYLGSLVSEVYLFVHVLHVLDPHTHKVNFMHACAKLFLLFNLTLFMIGWKPTPPPSCNNYVVTVGLGDGGGEERLIGFGWSQVLQTCCNNNQLLGIQLS